MDYEYQVFSRGGGGGTLNIYWWGQGRNQDFEKGEARIPNLYNMIVVGPLLILKIVGSGGMLPGMLTI